MKTQSLRKLVLAGAVCLAPTAFAAVTINGTPFTSFTMTSATNGDITIKTVPAALAGTIPTVLPKSVFEITMTSEDGAEGNTTIDTFPGPGQEGGFTPINCVATPLDPACPVEPTPPPPGECGAEAEALIFETLAWGSQPRKISVLTGKKGAASKLTTTNSRTYLGSFQALADSASGHLTRKMWFSKCPGGEPLDQLYTFNGKQVNKCSISGVEPVLKWSQEDSPRSTNICKLSRGTTYYLNYTQSAFGSGAGPTSTSKHIRTSGVGGTP